MNIYCYLNEFTGNANYGILLFFDRSDYSNITMKSSLNGVKQLLKVFVFVTFCGNTLTLHGCKTPESRPEVLNCSFGNLTSYPNSVPQGITVLDLSHNALRNVVILNKTDVTHLNLSHNLIQRIEHNAFTALRNLVNLDLSFNLLKGSDIANKTYRFELSEFHALRWLSFRGNPLGLVSRMTFTQYGYLQLTELDLSYCGITSLEEMALSNLVKLRKLYLQYNNLRVLSGDSFSTLGELEELHVEHNKIRTVSSLTFMSLRALYLNFNNIDRLDGSALSHLVTLERLEVDHNNLKYLTPDSFPRDLQSASLDGNLWKCDCNMKWLLVNAKWIEFLKNNSLV